MARSKRNNVYQLTEALLQNGKAMEEGPRKKAWSIHDLRPIKPLNVAQEDVFHGFFRGQHICAHGSAGTGKSFIACFLALNELLRQNTTIDKIIIVRSAVQTREIGHLPGDLNEKVALYELPYHDIFAELLKRKNSYQDMKDVGWVRFNISSFVRSLTWNNAVVIVDETQNMTWQEIDSVITRIGEDSRLIICGDLRYQQDLPRREVSGFQEAINIMERMSCFDVVKFTHNDIVRSEFTREWIITRDELNIR